MKQCFWLLSVFLLSLVGVQVQAMQSCNSAIPAETPDSDFVVHNDGTVTHSRTGLMWKVCSEGQVWSALGCSGTATTHSWNLALQIPSILNVSGGYAGYNDWRLPNIRELHSIVEPKCAFSAINASIFPVIQNNFYWSSSPNFSNDLKAWGVHRGGGNYHSINRNNVGYIHLIRGR